MRIIKYLLKHPAAILVTFALLICLAYCDLSLPNYTSDIVDVGIQQGGVEDVATTDLSSRTYTVAQMLLSGDDLALVEECYDPSGDNYTLNATGEAKRAELDEAMELPMIVAHYDASTTGFDFDQVLAAYEAGQVTAEQVQEGLSQLDEYLDQMGDSLVEQQAISGAKAEYEQLGTDMDALQMDYLKRIGLSMLALAVAAMVLNILISLVASRTGARIGHDLRERFFDRVLSFSDAEVGRFSAASLITRGTNDIQLVQFISIMLLRMVLYAPVLAIGGLIMISTKDVSMVWVIALGVVLIFLVIGILMVISIPKFKIMQTLIDKVNLISREMLTGIPVVRAFGREKHEEQRFAVANGDLMRTQLFTNRVMTFMMPVMMMVMNCLSVLIVWVGGHAVNDGTMQTGDLIAFITYAMVIIMSFLIIGMVGMLLPRASVAAGRIDEVINTQPGIVDSPDALAGQLPAEGGLDIRFDHVTFAYAADADPVLTDVSFHIPAGSTTAIVGATGCGKSTALKLLERFYDVTEGSVTVAGIDVRQLPQHELRNAIGLVPQQNFLFGGTIASNVDYGNDEVQPDRINQALDIAQATEFVSQKEEGIDSPISQGGTNVSGGQRQRLAIARALAKDARAYVFDDSFSALDYKTDAALRQQLATRLSDRTVIIVAQRIATVMNADNIVVLDHGRVAGQGTHAQLLETCPVYKEIALSQLSEEELKGGERHE